VEPESGHGVEDTAVHRLEAVADVGERPPDDNGHGVVEVRLPHLLFDRDGCLALWAHRTLDIQVDDVERVLGSAGGFAPLPRPPPRNRCAGKAGARTAITTHDLFSVRRPDQISRLMTSSAVFSMKSRPSPPAAPL